MVLAPSKIKENKDSLSHRNCYRRRETSPPWQAVVKRAPTTGMRLRRLSRFPEALLSTTIPRAVSGNESDAPLCSLHLYNNYSSIHTPQYYIIFSLMFAVVKTHATMGVPRLGRIVSPGPIELVNEETTRHLIVQRCRPRAPAQCR